MQLSGEIVDGVTVRAVLTDANTPILPEGTTQRLDEFDKVFIELEAKQGKAQLGDFDLDFRQSEFARFSRKLQGITVQGELPAMRSGAFSGGTVSVAGASSRGIFRSQDILPIDGVQGPYRLEGANGERFIIVIPGSEAVYLDGIKLVRGQTNDYVIDYATAEVTFTPNRLITSDQRISVEFQFTTNQFTRTLVGSQVESRFWQDATGESRGRFGATFLRESDSRQFEEEFGFTSQDSMRVSASGDSLATRSGAEQVAFDPESPFVQYRQQIRIEEGGAIDTIFVALNSAPADTVQVFRVRFSRVGAGKGRYARVGRSVNGVQYEFRGPGMGDYEPVRLLPKPKQQQLLDFRGGIEPIKHVEVFGEWARSINDQNTLSSLDSQDDIDNAYIGGLSIKPTPVFIGGSSIGKISATFKRRFTGGNFATFDRTRDIEFSRQWNLLSRKLDVTGGVENGGDEKNDAAEVNYDFTEKSMLKGQFGRLRLGNNFEGRRRAVFFTSRENSLPAATYRLEYITSDDALSRENGKWFRQLGHVEKSISNSKLVPHFEWEHEHREQKVIGTDSLTATSFSFLELRPGISWTSPKLEIGLGLEVRTEKGVAKGRLLKAATANTIQWQLKYRPGANFKTDASVGYRTKRFRKIFRLNLQKENSESLVIRWNTDARPLKRALDIDWLYEAQTERTPTLQEIYVRTGPELGQFVWEDANSDGIIQVDEFIPERVPDEGTYVRTFLPSDSLSSVISLQARLRISVDPGRLFKRPESRLQRFLAGISARSTIEITEKSRDPDLKQIYLMNLTRFRSAVNTLNGRLRLAQEIKLFKNDSRYGLDLSFSQVRSLTELAAGEEERFLNVWRGDGRYRLAKKWNLKLAGTWQKNRVLSDAFASRRYDINGLTLNPELTFLPSTAARLSTGLSVARNRDTLGARSANVIRIPVDGRYRLARKFQMTTRLEMAQVSVRGDAVGLAQFELTDGRGPGTSFLWGFNGQYMLSRYLRASFSYDGRAPAESPVLHTVRMQLSAVF